MRDRISWVMWGAFSVAVATVIAMVVLGMTGLIGNSR